MQTINISLPAALNEQISSQVKAGNYASVSEFIREAVRKLLGISPTAFLPEAEEEILKISQISPAHDLAFDTGKTPLKKIFTKLRKMKV